MRNLVFLTLAASAVATSHGLSQRGAARRLIADRNATHESWIYNDVERGFAEAKKTGKPLLITFR